MTTLVIVALDADADAMNGLHGESYGVDWVYPPTPQSAQPVQPAQAWKLFRADCKECAAQKQADADNKEWQEGVKRGNEIVSIMSRAAIASKGAI